MKNIFVMLIIITCACNTVKKNVHQEAARSALTVDIKNDSTHVSEDLLQVENMYWQNDSKTMHVTFLPSTLSMPLKPIIISDSIGITTIDFGNNIPAAIEYTNNRSSLAKTDSVHDRRDSVTSIKDVTKERVTETKTKDADKKTSRFPWYFIIIPAILIVAGYLYYTRLK